MDKAKAVGMHAVLKLMSPSGTPDIYTAAKKICGDAVIGYDGNDPKGEMNGVDELISKLGEQFPLWKIGNASSVRKEIQKRIDAGGKVSNSKLETARGVQSDSARRFAEVGKRSGASSDPKMGGALP